MQRGAQTAALEPRGRRQADVLRNRSCPRAQIPFADGRKLRLDEKQNALKIIAAGLCDLHNLPVDAFDQSDLPFQNAAAAAQYQGKYALRGRDYAEKQAACAVDSSKRRKWILRAV